MWSCLIIIPSYITNYLILVTLNHNGDVVLSICNWTRLGEDSEFLSIYVSLDESVGAGTSIFKTGSHTTGKKLAFVWGTKPGLGFSPQDFPHPAKTSSKHGKSVQK